MTTTYDIQYDRKGLRVEVPSTANTTLITKPAMPLLKNPEAAVGNALDHPVDCAALEELARGRKRVCIAICDITRPVPNALFLRPMIERLVSAGVAEENICIVVATGLHRPNEGKELEELIGDPWVLERVRIFNHDARRDDEHVHLGRTQKRQTVVRLDRRFVEADLRIVTGLVEPHFMAGYSGGRKVVAPGLAHAETITTFHSSRFMADPAARNCNFTGNPLHEEQLEIIDLVGETYAVNTVIDEQRRLAFVNFGEVLSSHSDAVDFVRQYCEIEVQQHFDVVLTSAAGYPLDKTYYQTVKGMVGAMDILKPGGELIIASACSEGMGSAEYIEAQRRLVSQGPDSFLHSLLEKSHADIDEWQTQMQLKPQSIGTVHLFTEGLSEQEQALTGVHCVANLNACLLQCLSRIQHPDLAIIPEGPYVVPFCRDAESIGH